MNDSSRRSFRHRVLFCGALALLLSLPAAADPVVRLLPAAGQAGEIAAQAGLPVELTIVKSRDGAAAIDEPLAWAVDSGEGTLEVLDARSRPAADAVGGGAGAAGARRLRR